MGLTKTEIYQETQLEIASMARAFSHPARVAILQKLIDSKSCVCGVLVSEIGLAQPTISQHLKELKLLGLVKARVQGTSMCYCIQSENWNKMKEIMSGFLNQDVYAKEC